MTLEVRKFNVAAQTLYRQLGFQTVGRRRRYYRDTGEDALLMTLADPHSAEVVQALALVRARTAARLRTLD